MTTPRYNQRGIRYTAYQDKYRALLRQGFDETSARRMAQNLDEVYG